MRVLRNAVQLPQRRNERRSSTAIASTWAISCSLPYTYEVCPSPDQELKTLV